MTEFVWRIESLERRPKVGDLDDVVTTVHYRVFAKDGEYNSDAYGVVAVGEPGDGFKPFAELTPDDCKGWVLETLAKQQTALAKKEDEDAPDATPDVVEKLIQTTLQHQINEQKQPSILAGVPAAWEDGFQPVLSGK